MKRVARESVNRNMRNFIELRREVKAGLSEALRKRTMRSRQSSANMLNETTWKTRPATRRPLPVLPMLGVVAVAATPPPAP